jgi:hypothetical protein
MYVIAVSIVTPRPHVTMEDKELFPLLRFAKILARTKNVKSAFLSTLVPWWIKGCKVAIVCGTIIFNPILLGSRKFDL